MGTFTETKVDAVPEEKDLALKLFLEPLRPFLDDPTISEVCINRPGVVYTEGRNGWAHHAVPRLTFEHCSQLAQLIATRARQRLSEEDNLLSAPLPNGERAQVVLPPSCPPGTVSITIRTAPPPANKTLAEYTSDGFFEDVRQSTPALIQGELDLLALRKTAPWRDFIAAAMKANKQWLIRLEDSDIELLRLRDAEDWPAFLRLAVSSHKNIIVSGGTGSGKTTLCRTLIEDMDRAERIITIEDTPELALPNHPNHVHLFYAKDGQGISKSTPQTLLASCMRMKPDRILLAELRGGEAYDYMLGVNSGHPGSITTVHSNSPEGAFDQLSNYMKRHKDAQFMAREDLLRLLYKTVDVVCQVHKDPRTGQRRMTALYFEPRCQQTGQGPHEYRFGAE